MQAETLPVEIWRVIHGHLRRPMPAPLSRPPRNALRQHDLATTSRVCKMFYSICNPLLYRHIVTDDFPTLFLIGNNFSRRKHLSKTESLYIEYREKGSDPAYQSLMQDGGHLWERCAGRLKSEWREETIMHECKNEVFKLSLCLTNLKHSGTRTILPRLRTVAVSSTYGREDDVWARYDDTCVESGVGSDVDSTIQLWQQVLATSNIDDLCIRDPGGPLSLLPIVIPSRLNPHHPYRYTIHFNAKTDIMSLILGGPTTWLLDLAPTESWSTIFRNLGANIAKMMIHRKAHYKDRRLPPINLDIYCSTSYMGKTPGRYRIDIELKDVADGDYTTGEPLTVDQQRRMCDKLAAHCQGLLRDHSGVKDELRLHPSADSPICMACGTGPPC